MSLFSSLTPRAAALGLAAVVAAVPAPAAAQSLEKRLTKRLDLPPLDRHHWGIAVLDDRGRLVFGRDAERMFTPASNTKLIVTAVGTALLGPDFRVTTGLFAAGPVEDGVVTGDLVIAGRGDPGWAAACYGTDTLAAGVCTADPLAPLRPLAGQLKSRGVRRIAGAVVGDGSWFEPTMVAPTWEHDDLPWGYGAPVAGLGFNENQLVVTVTATTAGMPATIAVKPDLGAIGIINRVVTADTGHSRVEWTRTEDGVTAVAEGVVRPGEPVEDEIAVADPNRFAALALIRVLADSGIEVLGGVAGNSDPARYQAATAGEPLARIDSRPLRDWVFRILNVSQNWIAEMLLKQLSRRRGGDGSWSDGVRLERRFLIDSVGIDSTQFVLHDGSGLSGKDAVSPLTFARLLEWFRRDSRFPDFAAGLPVSGAVGSLRNRFLGTPVAGRIRAKTGSIGQVNTLSGFVEREGFVGPPCWIFSVQANHHTLGGRTMIQAIDSVVVESGRRTACAAER